MNPLNQNEYNHFPEVLVATATLILTLQEETFEKKINSNGSRLNYRKQISLITQFYSLN